ncbi:MAG TPA: efflux RND transporter periplasmic adaptor subunit [bacterium]|nr:efflux RND transporter periplasmic adaptor subunit [bacterium]
MKKWVVLTGGLAVVCLIFLFFYLFSSGSNRDERLYRTVRVTRRDIYSSVLATGIIKPMVGAEVRVGSRVSGVVKRLHADIGDEVQKGRIIAELDATELQARVDQARADVENARANYDYAELDLERQRTLFQKSLISQSDLDLAKTTRDINRARYEQARANLDYALVQLDYTRITAPISGVVASISTQEGETVAASFSAPTFVNIIDLNRLEVWAYVDETDIGRISEGQKAGFTVDTYMDTDFEGEVTAIYPKAVIQDNVVTYIVTIRIADFKGKILRPEMTTTVSIYLEAREGVLTLPRSAVQRGQRGYRVAVLENGRRIEKEIQTGWSSNDYIEIIYGLQEGDEVITEG